MSLIALKCPNCNAPLEAEDSREFIFCSYCGTRVAMRSDVGSEVKINRDDEVRNWCMLAETFLQSGSYPNAYLYSSKAVEASPGNLDAWVIKALSTTDEAEGSACATIVRRLTNDFSELDGISDVVRPYLERVRIIRCRTKSVSVIVTFVSDHRGRQVLDLEVGGRKFSIRSGEAETVEGSDGPQEVHFRVTEPGLFANRVVVSKRLEVPFRQNGCMAVRLGKKFELDVTTE